MWLSAIQRWLGLVGKQKTTNPNACCLCRNDRDESDKDPTSSACCMHLLAEDTTALIAGFPDPAAKTCDLRERLIQGIRPNVNLDSLYELDEIHGGGSMSDIRLVRRKQDHSCVRALKRLNKLDVKERSARREIAILQMLDHPGICRLLEVYEDSFFFNLVLEHIDGHELRSEIPTCEHRAACIMHQLFNALAYCHKRNVIHRDVKLENIMIQEWGDLFPNIKLIDFGLSIVSSETYTSSPHTGTEHYMAPEIASGIYSSAVDVWSAGVVLHAALRGRFPGLPFDGSTSSRSQVGFLSAPAKSLIHCLLQTNPSSRITAASAAAHMWTIAGKKPPTSGQLAKVASKRTILDFMSFRCSCPIRRSALTALTMQLTDKQLQGFQDDFSLMDSDSDGCLSKEELLRVMLKVPTEEVQQARDWAEACCHTIFLEDPQEVSFTEWVASAMQRPEYQSHTALRGAFSTFDSICKGYISVYDLARVATDGVEEAETWMMNFTGTCTGAMDLNAFQRLVFQSQADSFFLSRNTQQTIRHNCTRKDG